MKRTLLFISSLIVLVFFAHCGKDNQVNQENIALTDHVMEFVDDHIQEQLDLASDKEVPEMLESLSVWLSEQEGVINAVPYGDSIVVTYVDESESIVTVYDMTLQDETEYDFYQFFNRNGAETSQEQVMIGNHNVFIYDAYALDENLREGDSIDKLFSFYGNQPTHLKDEQCTVESLRQLTQYGYILLATHGAPNCFATRELVTSENRLQYLDDRLAGKLKVYSTVYKIENGYEYSGRYYWVTNKFINELEGRFNKAVVFNSSCESLTGDAPLKNAFLNKGAATYYGFDNDVESYYKYYASACITEALLRNYTTGEAFDLFASVCPQSSYGTAFAKAGDDDVTWYEIPDVPTDGLVAYYPFNGNADDASGHGNNGILSGQNVPVLTMDRKGCANSAYEFGGYYNRNWIRVPNSETLQFDKEFTVAFWIQQTELAGMDGWGNYSTTGPGFAAVCKAGDGNACYPGLYITTGIGENGEGLHVGTNNSNGNAHNHDTWNHDINYDYRRYQLGDWIHVALVVENVNKILCINGLEVARDELGKEADFTSMNQQDLYIGVMAGWNLGSEYGTWYPFYGKIDDVRVYNRALDPFEIKALARE